MVDSRARQNLRPWNNNRCSFDPTDENATEQASASVASIRLKVCGTTGAGEQIEQSFLQFDEQK